MKQESRKKPTLVLFVLALIIIGFFANRYKQNTLAPTPRKNLIIISIDSLRKDHLSLYGYNRKTTPNIDKWAEKATVFTGMYTQDPETYPSFASLMTGISPFESNIYVNGDVDEVDAAKKDENRFVGAPPVKQSSVTLAEALKSNNYLTGGFVANKMLHPYLTSIDQGFSTYWMSPYSGNQKTSGSVTNKALEWLLQNKTSGKPLFMWVHYLDPHYLYLPTPTYACEFNKRFCRNSAKADIKNLSEEEFGLRGCHKADIVGNEVIELHKSLYDGEIKETDFYVGKLLAELEKNGFTKNSIIVILADHGESFEKSYYFQHSDHVYESSMNIPLIIYDPDSKAKNKKYDFLLKHSDVYSTVLSLLGIKSPVKRDYNFDFSEYIKDSNTKLPTSKPLFYINSSATRFGLREGDYKYILSLDNDTCGTDSKKELYNLTKDPQEENNLINEKSQKEVADRLYKQLTGYLAKNPLDIGNKKTQQQYRELFLTDEKKQELMGELKSLGY